MNVSWRRFRVLLGGILSDPGSAFAAVLAAEQEEADEWRRALGRATGRDYSRAPEIRRVSLEDFAATTGAGA